MEGLIDLLSVGEDLQALSVGEGRGGGREGGGERGGGRGGREGREGGREGESQCRQ
jgi:hypothetical protein